MIRSGVIGVTFVLYFDICSLLFHFYLFYLSQQEVMFFHHAQIS